VGKRSQELIDGLRDAGYGVVGNLSDLEPVVPVPGAVDPAQIDQAVFLDTALDALAGLITNRPQADDQP
jgi:hypothetical protein